MTADYRLYRLHSAISAAKSVGVEPPNQLKAKHFTDPNIEHISVMAFLTKLMQIGDRGDKLRIIGLNLNNVFVNKEVRCTAVVLSPVY